MICYKEQSTLLPPPVLINGNSSYTPCVQEQWASRQKEAICSEPQLRPCTTYYGLNFNIQQKDLLPKSTLYFRGRSSKMLQQIEGRGCYCSFMVSIFQHYLKLFPVLSGTFFPPHTTHLVHRNAFHQKLPSEKIKWV